MLPRSGVRPAKWLAVANLAVAAGAAAVAVFGAIGLVSPSPTQDIDAFGYSFLALLFFLPVAASFALAAAAFWWGWPLRWLFQGLAVLLPVGILVLSAN